MGKGFYRKFDVGLLLVVVAILIWSAIKPDKYSIWLSEVLPAVVVITIAIVSYKRFRLTKLSYLVIAILSISTFVGGHYTYTKVPLFDWIKDDFGFERNHYDRFGHFIKGLITIVIREILIRKTPLTKNSWLFSISLGFSLAVGALYEIIEWLSLSISKKFGREVEDYLGMQGDMWDAQWDMTMLLIGSVLALLTLTKLHNKMLKRHSLKNE